MQQCNDFKALIEEYIDNELSENVKVEFEAHIEECISCREKLEFAKEIREILNTTKFPEPPKDFIKKVNSRIDAEISHSKVYNFKKYFLSRKYQTVAACFIIAAFLGVGAEKMMEDVNLGNKDITVGNNQVVISEVITPTNTPEENIETPVPKTSANISKNTPKPKKTAPPEESITTKENDDSGISIASFTEDVPINEGPGPRMIDIPEIYEGEIKVSPEYVEKTIAIAEQYSKAENEVYEMNLEDFRKFLSELYEAEIEYVTSVEENDPVSFKIIAE